MPDFKVGDRVRAKEPKDPRRNLVRAAALILAEIERRDRTAGKAGVEGKSNG